MYIFPKNLISIELKNGFSLFKNLHSPKSLLVLDKEAATFLDKVVDQSYEASNDKEKKVLQLCLEHHILLPENSKLTFQIGKSNILSSWFHITNQCNLRCKYCYVHKDNKCMSDEMGIKVIDKLVDIAKKDDKKELKIKFSGGEASLQFPKLIRFNNYAKDKCKNAGLRYRSVMLSNGVNVSDQILETLIKDDIDLMLSIDGLEEDHDSQRVFPDGSGSYKFVWKTINKCIEYRISPYISVTVTNQSVKNLHKLVKILLEKDLNFNFNFVRETECVQANTGKLVFEKQQQDFINGLNKALDVIEGNAPKRSMLNSLGDRALLNSFREITCGVKNNYIVVNHLGKISDCQMLMSKPICDIDTNDLLKQIRSNTKYLENPKVDEKGKCKDCKWKYYCCGGCPIVAKNTYGDSKHSSPYCDIYQAILPRILKIEGLRLLKYQLKNTH